MEVPDAATREAILRSQLADMGFVFAERRRAGDGPGCDEGEGKGAEKERLDPQGGQFTVSALAVTQAAQARAKRRRKTN